MEAKLASLIHKTAIQLHLVAESCIICSSRSRRPVRKLGYTLISTTTVAVGLPQRWWHDAAIRVTNTFVEEEHRQLFSVKW